MAEEVSSPPGPQIGILEIKIVSATNLAAKDFSITGKGSSDPYARITFTNSHVDGVKRKTMVRSKSLNPVWNATWTVPIYNAYTELNVTIWDEDKISQDDFLGGITVPIIHLRNARLYDAEYELKGTPPDNVINAQMLERAEAAKNGKKKKKKDDVTGSLRLVLRYTQTDTTASFMSHLRDVPQDYMSPKPLDESFSLGKLLTNIGRLGPVLQPVLSAYWKLWEWWLWEDPLASSVALMTFVFLCLRPGIAPFFFLSWATYKIGRKWYIKTELGGEKTMVVVGEDTEDPGVLENARWAQNTLGQVCDQMEKIWNVFNWTVPSVTKEIFQYFSILSILSLLIPFRFIVLAIGVFLWISYTKVFSGIYSYIFRWQPSLDECLLGRVPTDKFLYEANLKKD